MLNRSCTVVGLLLGLVLVVGCHGYGSSSSFPLSSYEPLYRHSKKEDVVGLYPKLSSDFFASSSDSEDRSRVHEESDSSVSSDEVAPLQQQQQVSKRRKGPTLSVVNPLEILRQRLMLDLARRRIHENQQQIVANAQLLENIGKRSHRD